MAKGDNTGIAQHGASLNPYASMQGSAFMGPAFGGTFGPSPNMLQNLLSGIQGMQLPKFPGGLQNKVGGAQNKLQNIQQGINKLKGNSQQAPGHNKPQGSMRAMPQLQMMEGGGQFMLPEPRQMGNPFAMQMPQQQLMSMPNQSAGMMGQPNTFSGPSQESASRLLDMMNSGNMRRML